MLIADCDNINKNKWFFSKPKSDIEALQTSGDLSSLSIPTNFSFIELNNYFSEFVLTEKTGVINAPILLDVPTGMNNSAQHPQMFSFHPVGKDSVGTTGTTGKYGIIQHGLSGLYVSINIQMKSNPIIGNYYQIVLANYTGGDEQLWNFDNTKLTIQTKFKPNNDWCLTAVLNVGVVPNSILLIPSNETYDNQMWFSVLGYSPPTPAPTKTNVGGKTAVVGAGGSAAGGTAGISSTEYEILKTEYDEAIKLLNDYKIVADAYAAQLQQSGAQLTDQQKMLIMDNNNLDNIYTKYSDQVNKISLLEQQLLQNQNTIQDVTTGYADSVGTSQQLLDKAAAAEYVSYQLQIDNNQMKSDFNSYITNYGNDLANLQKTNLNTLSQINSQLDAQAYGPLVQTENNQLETILKSEMGKTKMDYRLTQYTKQGVDYLFSIMTILFWIYIIISTFFSVTFLYQYFIKNIIKSNLSGLYVIKFFYFFIYICLCIILITFPFWILLMEYFVYYVFVFLKCLFLNEPFKLSTTIPVYYLMFTPYLKTSFNPFQPQLQANFSF